MSGYQAGDRQLWEDEHATWHAATLSFPDFARLLGHVDFALSPYYLGMRAWIAIFGDSALSLRAPSVLAMALTSGLLVLLGRRLVNVFVGLIAGLLFALVPSVSRFAQDARPYAFAVLFAVLATLLLVRAMERPSWPRWLLYGLAVILLGLAHIVSMALLVAHFVAIRHAAKQEDTVRLWRWLAPFVLAVCVVGPFALSASKQAQAISWIKADPPTLRAFPEQLFGSAVVAALIAGLAVAGIWSLLRQSGPQLPMLTAWVLVPPLVTWLTFPLLHLFLFRYLLFTVPAWVLLAAAGIDGLGRAAAKANKVALSALAALVVLPAIAWLALPGQLGVRKDPEAGYPDYRQVANTISARLQPGDGIAYGGQYFRVRRGLGYELRDRAKPRDVFLAESGAKLGGYVSRECPVPAKCLGSTQRIWLVNTAKTNDIFAEMPSLNAALLRERFTVAEKKEFTNVRLVLLILNPLPPA